MAEVHKPEFGNHGQVSELHRYQWHNLCGLI